MSPLVHLDLLAGNRNGEHPPRPKLDQGRAPRGLERRISAPRLWFRGILALLGMGEWQNHRVGRVLRDELGVVRCTYEVPVKCPSYLTKTPKLLTTAQHYRGLLVSVKLSVTTTMFRLSQNAPIVLVFWALLPYRQAMRICHPIRLADKVLHHSQFLHLVSRFHQRRNWCSKCR